MKAKKLITAIAAISMVSAFAFIACDSDSQGGHAEHDYTWSVKTPATCTEDGVEEGVCSCGDKITRPISAAHKYGEWQIVSMPSEHGAGKAQKICSADSSHVIDVTLPAFDRAGKREYASFEEDGHFVNFTYAHESGDIVAKTVASVGDALQLGLENKSSVVSGTATVIHDYKIYGTKSEGNLTYEFGDNYLHVNDTAVDRREYFYTLNEDGTMFPVYLEWKDVTMDGQDEESPSPVRTSYQDTLNNKDATPEMMGGFGFFFTWLNGSDKSYGIENFIDAIYKNYYEVNANGDATASVEMQSDGSLLFKLSVNVHSVLNIDLLHKIDVAFTLDENNVIKTAFVRDCTWNNPVQDPNTLLWSVPENSEYVVMDEYSVVQQTEREEGAEVPTNPYNLEDMLVTSYDMYLNDTKIEDGATLEIDANQVSVIDLKNIQPAETFNLNFDEFTVTLTDSDGNSKPCIPNATHLSDGEILAQIITLVSYDGQKITRRHTLQIKSLLAGEFTLTVNSAKLTKTFKLKVNTVAPAEFGATVYEKNAMKDVWDIDNYNSEFTVYTGQSFNFTSYVGHPAYEETAFTLSVSRGEDVDIESDYTVGEATIEGVKVKRFAATVAGDYKLTLINIKQLDGVPVTYDVIVHVVPAPEMTDVLNGKYFNIDAGFEITFTPSADGAADGTAILKTGVGGKNETNTVLSYSYAKETGVTLKYVSGGLDKYKFDLVFDDAYNMYLSYTTAMGTNRSVYLYNEIPNLIEGTYRITMSSSSAAKLVVNIDGTYSITTNSYAGVYYGIWDAKTDRQIGDNIALTPDARVDLSVGQVLRVWCIGQQHDDEGKPVEMPTEYTVTFIPEEEGAE